MSTAKAPTKRPAKADESTSVNFPALQRELTLAAGGICGHAPDSLFTDDRGNWYLGRLGYRRARPVSVAEALAWYSEWGPRAKIHAGYPFRLCGAAAQELKKGIPDALPY